MREINFKELEKGYLGTKFYQLIEYHLRRTNTKELHRAVLGTIDMLPPKAQFLAEDFIDHWNEKAYIPHFWQEDTAKILNIITSDAEEKLKNLGISSDDEMLFNMFQIVVLSYAYLASNQPKMREFIGIKNKKFLGLF